MDEHCDGSLAGVHHDASLYDAALRGGYVGAEIVGRGGEPLYQQLRAGDRILRRVPGEGRLTLASTIREDPDVASAEIAVEDWTGGTRRQQVLSPSGLLADGIVILRQHAFFGESTDDELRAKRRTLVAGLQASDLEWLDISLADGYAIKVCAPVRKDNVYVPVTAPETFSLSRRFGGYPLSRAVFDQVHNAYQLAPRPESPTSRFDFETYGRRMKEAFGDYYGTTMLSGAHKLWVVSSRGVIINYGFHKRRARGEPFRGGRYLDSNRFTLIQGLGAFHANQVGHWDYSQMLQIMKDLRDSSGRAVDLRRALLDGLPAIWDEPAKITATNLPAEGEHWLEASETDWNREQPAPRALWNIVHQHMPSTRFLGIYAPRNVAGTNRPSAHAEGRALDIGQLVTRPHEQANGDLMFETFIREHEELGLDHVIWNRRIWSVARGGPRPYTGQNPHIDHVHVAWTREGSQRTTFPRTELSLRLGF